MMIIGSHLLALERIDSTSSYLGLLQQRGPQPEGTVVVAEHQTAGRGQRGNSWEAPPGQNLTLSILLYPRQLPPQQVFVLNQMASLGVARALTALGVPDVQVKWPNDILIDGRKVCGLLLENAVGNSRIQYSVLGVGLNVDAAPPYATTVNAHLPNPLPKSMILTTLLDHLNAAYLQLQQQLYARMAEDYLSRLYLRGVPHVFTVEDQPLPGTILGISPEGLLEVETDAGIRRFDLKQIAF